MPVAGYSGTPLVKKLGIKAGHVVGLVQPPDHVMDLLVDLPEDATVRVGARGKPDVSLVFVRKIADLAKRVEQLWRLAFPNRAVWVCWPKKSSALYQDLREDDIRTHVLGRGLVDVKVCAVDGDWSGLKLMVRKELR
ncbi:MAG: DUF3052 domain-containing protein [Deltaproteobacteria bacterium]|nr:DUF3052 domain-containing protein [Deltaproteobacteria bacterium]